MKTNITSVKNVRGFEIKYLGPTDTKGSRVRITDIKRFSSIIIPFDYECNSSADTAFRYLESIGFTIHSRFWSDDRDYLMCDDFNLNLKP